ncbi:MAG: hypothetical protein WCB58_09800 [Acidobacteriaceae bacterium]
MKVNLKKGERTMLLYSFNADFREVLRRLATAAQNDDGQNSGVDEKGSVHTLGRHAAMEPQHNGGRREPINHELRIRPERMYAIPSLRR